MKKYILFIFFLWGCGQEEDPARHFTTDQQGVLMQQMVTYLGKLAPGATFHTRFQPQFVKFYQESTQHYAWEAYHPLTDTSGYFLVIRPVGNDPKTKRAVGGYFSYDPNSWQIKNFREEFNSPRLKPSEAQERGRFVWKELIKKGTIQHVANMKHYIEWPDERLQYDERTHQWLARP